MWKTLCIAAGTIAVTAGLGACVVPVDEHRHHERGYYHDEDHDGVRNRDDRDRDGDRVPNWRDRAPDDPHRY